MTSHTEEQIRLEVTKAAKARHIPEPIWDDVRADLPAIAEADPQRRKELIGKTVDLVKRDLKLIDSVRAAEAGANPAPSGGRRQPRPQQADVPLLANSYESDRARVFSLEIAGMATAEDDIRAFRNEALGGKLLAPDQVLDFVSDPAVTTVDRGPVRRVNPAPTDDLQVESEGYMTDDHGRWWEVVLRGGSTGKSYTKGVRPPLPTFTLPIGVVEYWPDSVLSELHELAVYLSKRYPWGEAEAAWFVLTGTVPAVSPFHIVYQRQRGKRWNRATLTMIVEPWVPAETVEREYRALQLRILDGDNRRRGKALELWRFARELEIEKGRPMKRAQILREWSKTDRGRNKTRQPFYELYKRGREFASELMRPSYRALRGTVSTPNLTPSLTPKPKDGHGLSRTNEGGRAPIDA